MQNLVSISENASAVYISEIMMTAGLAGSTPNGMCSTLLGFDSAIYLNKVASHIGHVSQLAFEAIPSEGYVKVKTAPIIGSTAHIPLDILDITRYSSILAEYNCNTPALKQALEDIYQSNGHAVGLDLTLKSYQMNQYAVINQSVARMGGLFFGYASICLETAKNLYQLGEVNQSIDLLKNLRSEAETLQEVFSEPRSINNYLPVPVPFAKFAAIGLCTGVALFVTMNFDKFAPIVGV